MYDLTLLHVSLWLWKKIIDLFFNKREFGLVIFGTFSLDVLDKCQLTLPDVIIFSLICVCEVVMPVIMVCLSRT